MNVEKYEDCLDELLGKKRTLNLMLGNGFSMAYDAKIFSYNALQSFIADLKDPIVNHLFKVVKSKNLEVIMNQLVVLSQLLEAFDAPSEIRARVASTEMALASGLIDAVRSLHPEHVFAISDGQIEACSTFLKPYLDGSGLIFTANYDFLLYWVLMRSKVSNAVDGFGRELLNPESFDTEFSDIASELTWGPNESSQNIFYLHGALHLFDDGIEIVKEEYSGFSFLLQRVQERIKKGTYPIFVAAGSGEEKLAQIMHNKYLENCYSKLCSINGSLVVFGFNFGAYDEHIIQAINKAAKHGRKAGDKLFSVYVGVFSEADEKHMSEIIGKFKCKVRLFDSRSVDPWGTNRS